MGCGGLGEGGAQDDAAAQLECGMLDGRSPPCWSAGKADGARSSAAEAVLVNADHDSSCSGNAATENGEDSVPDEHTAAPAPAPAPAREEGGGAWTGAPASAQAAPAADALFAGEAGKGCEDSVQVLQVEKTAGLGAGPIPAAAGGAFSETACIDDLHGETVGARRVEDHGVAPCSEESTSGRCHAAGSPARFDPSPGSLPLAVGATINAAAAAAASTDGAGMTSPAAATDGDRRALELTAAGASATAANKTSDEGAIRAGEIASGDSAWPDAASRKLGGEPCCRTSYEGGSPSGTADAGADTVCSSTGDGCSGGGGSSESGGGGSGIHRHVGGGSGGGGCRPQEPLLVDPAKVHQSHPTIGPHQRHHHLRQNDSLSESHHFRIRVIASELHVHPCHCCIGMSYPTSPGIRLVRGV